MVWMGGACKWSDAGGWRDVWVTEQSGAQLIDLRHKAVVYFFVILIAYPR